ncbi:hypothetical protein O181_067856 [Austropuccinia psidii MF-1]|uniref:Tf2-1-like SH3-like domain-containing protein n=1 Tax=Austropuccinia psidii MF-1 TaxID=1389203 RepID=A0A9Q3F0I2_9BASI|nr:hypothetical protein [Austropuccinia psidii MF-1]
MKSGRGLVTQLPNAQLRQRNIIRRGGTNHTWNLNLNKGTNLRRPKKMRDSFLGPFTIIKLKGKNAVEVKLTEEFSRKNPAFPVSLVKPYFQTEEDKFPSRKKNPTYQR